MKYQLHVVEPAVHATSSEANLFSTLNSPIVLNCNTNMKRSSPALLTITCILAFERAILSITQRIIETLTKNIQTNYYFLKKEETQTQVEDPFECLN